MLNNTPEVKKDRNGSADLIKGVAVLLMIQVHIMEQLASPDLYNSALGKISLLLGGPACAPIFMAVLGYFLAFKDKTLLSFLKRGVLLFAGGILLNIGRSANLLILIFRGDSALNPWHYIFGADILTLAGLSVLAIGLLRLVFKTYFLPYILTAVIMVVISPLLTTHAIVSGFPSYLAAFLWGDAEWSYFPVFPWMAYVLAGYAFKLFINKVKWVKRFDIREHFYFVIPLWVIILITMPWASRITSDLAGPLGYYHHGILFFMWALLFMISYLLIILRVESEYNEHWLSRFVKWLGAKVTVLYIIQWLIIGNIASVLYRSQHLFLVIAWFPIVVLASSLATILLQKIWSVVHKKA